MAATPAPTASPLAPAPLCRVYTRVCVQPMFRILSGFHVFQFPSRLRFNFSPLFFPSLLVFFSPLPAARRDIRIKQREIFVGEKEIGFLERMKIRLIVELFLIFRLIFAIANVKVNVYLYRNKKGIKRTIIQLFNYNLSYIYIETYITGSQF